MNKLLTYEFDLKSSTGIIIYIFLVLLAAWLISRLIRYIILVVIKSKKSERFGRTSIQFLRNSVKFFIGIFALIFIVITVPTLRSKATIIFSGAVLSQQLSVSLHRRHYLT